MKTLFKLKALTFFVSAFLLSSMAFGQGAASPRDSVSGTINGAAIKIAYGSPSSWLKERKDLGRISALRQNLENGQPNPVTTFQTSKEVNIEGKTLPAGKYSLFTIPGEKEWKVIFNSQTGQWGIKRDGSANDDPAKDVLVVTATPMKSMGPNERLTFKIDKNGFVLLWDNLAVPVKVK